MGIGYSKKCDLKQDDLIHYYFFLIADQTNNIVDHIMHNFWATAQVDHQTWCLVMYV